MNDNDSRRGLPNQKRGYRASAGDADDAAPEGGRREPVFSDFDEDEDYEESDRDTDYASAYEEDESDEEDGLDPLDDDGSDDEVADWQVLGSAPGDHNAPAATRNPWDVAETPRAESSERSPGMLPPLPRAPLADDDQELDEDDPDAWDEEDELDDYPDDVDDLDDLDDSAELDDQDDYDDEQAEPAQRWPLGMVVVAIVALVLLAAGGYGVIQQRAAAQEEIRQLQAKLATAANPTDVAGSREALREMEQRSAEDKAAIEALTLENRRLTDTVAGLETQLQVQQTATAPAAAPRPAPAPAKPAPKPAPAKAAAAAPTGGEWFVNFSSYTQRNIAESWVRKLQPAAGKAVVASSSVDGKTYYRVRIVGLRDRAQAEQVAKQLQQAHNLPQLWVGTE